MRKHFGIGLMPGNHARILLVCLVVAWGIFIPAVTAGEIKGVIRPSGHKLMLEGKEYRAIGVNMPHLSWAWSGTWVLIDGNGAEEVGEVVYHSKAEAKEAIRTGIKEAAASGAEFIRYFASPGFPREIAALYARDEAAYWKSMDELLALCRAHGLRVVPSLYPAFFGWHLYFGEPGSALADPQSKTYKAVMSYMRQFVTRYKEDPVILMWELSNEILLESDVDKKGHEAFPPYVYAPHTTEYAETWSRADSLTWDMIQRIYKDQTGLIKSLDPTRAVTSGDAYARPECTSRRETFPDFELKPDTFREWLANNLMGQCEPLDVFSIHVYGRPGESDPTQPWGLSSLEQMRSMIQAAHAARMPVFIGELGQEDPSFQDDSEAKWTRAAIDVAEEEGVSLIALWVWHFPWQPDRTLSAETHPKLVERMREFNERYACPGSRP